MESENPRSMDTGLKAVETSLDSKIEPWIHALENAEKTQGSSFQRELDDLANEFEQQRGNVDEVYAYGEEYNRLYKKYLTSCSFSQDWICNVTLMSFMSLSIACITDASFLAFSVFFNRSAS